MRRMRLQRTDLVGRHNVVDKNQRPNELIGCLRDWSDQDGRSSSHILELSLDKFKTSCLDHQSDCSAQTVVPNRV